MQVTDLALIHYRTHNYGELRDGLHTFCEQGAAHVEMIMMLGQEQNSAGRTVDYDLYEIVLRKAPETLELTDLRQFVNLTREELDRLELVRKEYYDDQASAYARYMQLVIEHNHF